MIETGALLQAIEAFRRAGIFFDEGPITLVNI